MGPGHSADFEDMQPGKWTLLFRPPIMKPEESRHLHLLPYDSKKQWFLPRVQNVGTMHLDCERCIMCFLQHIPYMESTCLALIGHKNLRGLFKAAVNELFTHTNENIII